MMEIWRRGRKARGAGDYGAAIRDFEAIQKQLPKTEWPGGLTVELNLAKNALEAQKKKAGK